MRKLDNQEMMALRIALEKEFKNMHRLVDSTPDGYSKASYRMRLERVENLISLFSPGTTVTVGV